MKRLDGVNADSTESMKFLKISEKAKEIRLKFSKGNARIKLTKTQLNKLKSPAKSRIGIILRIRKKNF